MKATATAPSGGRKTDGVELAKRGTLEAMLGTMLVETKGFGTRVEMEETGTPMGTRGSGTPLGTGLTMSLEMGSGTSDGEGRTG